MDNIKSDKYYIEKVKENIDAIISYTANKSYDEFVSDCFLIDATMFRLIQMIENLNKISDEYRQEHSKIAWCCSKGRIQHRPSHQDAGHRSEADHNNYICKAVRKWLENQSSRGNHRQAFGLYHQPVPHIPVLCWAYSISFSVSLIIVSFNFSVRINLAKQIERKSTIR